MNDLGYEVYSMKQSDIIGDIGEVLTANALRNCGLTVIRNLYLPYKDRTVEVDMVAICSGGVFVVENKNYRGVVEGFTGDEYWKVKYGYRVHKLYNPLKQNNLHISVLNGIIGNNIPLKNIVIFNDCVDRLSIRGDGSGWVFTLSSFIQKYKLWSLKGDIDIKEVVGILNKYSDMSEETRLRHVSSLHKCIAWG